MREIIDTTERVTKNKRKLCEGKCIECGGRLALMGGYAVLPETIYNGKYDSEE